MNSLSIEKLSPYKMGDILYYVGEENGIEKLTFGNPYRLEAITIFDGDVVLTVRGLMDKKLFHTIDRFMSQEELTMLLTDFFDEPVKDNYPEPEVIHVKKPEVDMVNQPPHYKKGGIETIAFIRAKLSKREYIGYLKGNIYKYLSRCLEKDSEKVDLGKMNYYSNELMKTIEGGVEND